jgi:hypothetical protein
MMTLRSLCRSLALLCVASIACGSGDDSPTASAGASGAGGSHASGALVSDLSGTLGELGAIEPIVSSFVIANSGEILIYLSSAPLTCSQIMVSRWLGSTEAGSQVVEIVVPAKKSTGTVQVGDADKLEVNYAEGGKSSAYEQGASAGEVTFTMSTPNGVYEGMVKATYVKPAGMLMGTFHAQFCAGGQGY